jgi:hypothetical protein
MFYTTQVIPAHGKRIGHARSKNSRRGRVESIGENKAIIQVAVGMPVTRHPPHRSGHEELPHPAPTSGSNAQTLLCRNWPLPNRLLAVSDQRTLQVKGRM